MITLIVALALAQDAEALLRKIEAAAAAAPLKVACELEGRGPHGAFKGTGTALFKPDRRARVSLAFDVAGQKAAAWMVSDGATVLTGDPALQSPAPGRPSAGFVRCGAVLLAQPAGNLAAGFDWGSVELRNLKLADGVLTYEFTLLDATYAAALHHDPATLKPTKRVVTFTAAAGRGEYRETYTAWTPGADVPDASFKLEAPAAK